VSLPDPATSVPSPGLPAPGWFADPTGESTQRYWDGSGWTKTTSGTSMSTHEATGLARTAVPTPQPAAGPPWSGVLTLVGAGMALLGAVLPWVTVTTIFGSLSKNGIDGDGRISALGGLALGVIALIVLVTKTQSRAPGVLAIVISLGILIVGAVDVADVSKRIGDLQGTDGVASAQVGIGLWVTCLAGLVGIAGGITAFTVGVTRGPASGITNA
jgi:Protein of unknown function (DUF2510)